MERKGETSNKQDAGLEAVFGGHSSPSLFLFFFFIFIHCSLLLRRRIEFEKQTKTLSSALLKL